MGRIRTIKPDFFRHEELYELEKKTKLPIRVAFAGLFTVADREGRFRWKPSLIKLDVLPFDEVDINEILSALWLEGFIKKYEIEGKVFGYIPSWKEHQFIRNDEAKSLIPEPERGFLVNPLELVTDSLRTHNVEGKGREEEKEENNMPEINSGDQDFSKNEDSAIDGSNCLPNSIGTGSDNDLIDLTTGESENGFGKREKKEDPFFEHFWNLYDKKVGKMETVRQWERLTHEEKTNAVAYVPAYKKSQPDKQFRKDPERFLKRKAWLNEISQPPATVTISSNFNPRFVA